MTIGATASAVGTARRRNRAEPDPPAALASAAALRKARMSNPLMTLGSWRSQEAHPGRSSRRRDYWETFTEGLTESATGPLGRRAGARRQRRRIAGQGALDHGVERETPLDELPEGLGFR